MSAEAARSDVARVTATHRGPAVAAGLSGTARFAQRIFLAFSPERALAMTAFADRDYREPGNDGFERVIDQLGARLHEVGYGTLDHLRLEVIETPLGHAAWTPIRARLAMRANGGAERVLHAFERPEDRDRTMLPTFAPSAAVTARLVTALDAVEPGCALLVDSGLGRGALRTAKERGAVLVMSSDLAAYNVDPTGAERHLDAIGYRRAPAEPIVPVAQISPRSARLLREALASTKDVVVSFEAEVSLADRPLRTLVATVVGQRFPEECVAIAAHVQEPGACDNASGIGTLLECARTTANLLATGELARPARSIAFVWGDEIEQSRIYLDRGGRRVVAGIAADMTGEDAALTGAVALLERLPDPGAVVAHAPDEHTAWSGGRASAVSAERLKPNGLNVIARSALADVGSIADRWTTSEHPYEGGSDHVEYLRDGIPAVLFWHFPDFAYHTSLDRLEHVDAHEMRSTGTAILATAFAVADPRPEDLDRYLRTQKNELDLRLAACAAASDATTAALWRAWANGARMWLRELCLPGARVAPATETPKRDEKP